MDVRSLDSQFRLLRYSSKELLIINEALQEHLDPTYLEQETLLPPEDGIEVSNLGCLLSELELQELHYEVTVNAVPEIRGNEQWERRLVSGYQVLCEEIKGFEVLLPNCLKLDS